MSVKKLLSDDPEVKELADAMKGDPLSEAVTTAIYAHERAETERRKRVAAETKLALSVEVCKTLVDHVQEKQDALGDYASADWINYKHGIPANRLSEGKKKRLIRWKPAPPGTVDRDNRPVKVLYHVEDAVKHANPKRVTQKTKSKVLGR